VTDFLNENQFIVGMILSILSGIELWFLTFHYESYCSFIRRTPIVKFLFREPESRILTISATLLFFVFGTAIVGKELGVFPVAFWAAVLSVAVINFFGTLAHYWWRKLKRGKDKRQ
jgi:hypothetical protein